MMTASHHRRVKRIVVGKSVDKPVNNAGISTRFAPSPNGYLHIGHAYAAMIAHDFARTRGGIFRLRIDDIDGVRSRSNHIEGIVQDMAWLGLQHDGDTIFQSQRIANYNAGFARLCDLGLTYRCFCTRADITSALKSRPVRHGPDGPVYPGTCRTLNPTQSAERGLHEAHCWRIDMAQAAHSAGPLNWQEFEKPVVQADPQIFGDIVIMRKDAPASYHLAATMDDAHDGISHVVRGADLFAYTAIHRLLQALLELPQPIYLHHRLLMDKGGHKLAKNRHSESLRALRKQGQNGACLIADLRAGKLPSGISLSNP